MRFTNLCQYFLVSTSVREKEKIIFCLCARLFSPLELRKGWEGGGGIKKKEREEIIRSTRNYIDFSHLLFVSFFFSLMIDNKRTKLINK